MIILPTTPLAVKSGRLPDRWIPSHWGWLYRACQFVLGAPRQVTFNVQCIGTSETVASVIAQNSLGPPQARSNGLAVWLVPESTLKPPKGFSSSAWGVNTVDRMKAGNSFGVANGPVVSYSSEFFPQLEKDNVDFSGRLAVTWPGLTNFVAAVHAQLPYNKTLFCLEVGQPESPGIRTVFLITADEFDAKGNKLQKRSAVR